MRPFNLLNEDEKCNNLFGKLKTLIEHKNNYSLTKKENQYALNVINYLDSVITRKGYSALFAEMFKVEAIYIGRFLSEYIVKLPFGIKTRSIVFRVEHSINGKLTITYHLRSNTISRYYNLLNIDLKKTLLSSDVLLVMIGEVIYGICKNALLKTTNNV